MRTISILAFTSFLVLWGVYFFLKDNDRSQKAQVTSAEVLDENLKSEGSVLSAKRKRDLDKIGAVINENNVRIDDSTREEIKTAKQGYETKEGVKELQAMLEQSYMDRNSTIKDIKRIQDAIIEKKNKLKETVTNTEKWDPRFVYYLMIQENYTYPEINMIKSLAENGLNMEEIEYINELIREDSFMDRIMAFKSQGDISRTVASFKKTKKKEVDDFIDDVKDGPSIEDKLIEMNYNQDEKEEMIYGNNQ
ncbi:hypothetical protein DOM21_13435 [Bacteriovorax stolpii]|uniref:Uncharacterized protein n=1 Tax=Bacteriovorax stolpii TaxID=960 RepID=A0A2K9NQ16_BACTC|nr:hypothetical protein [Bacteriovorax stolpii]AUN97597.1 hypothetical protein C0V70_05610 [Bacteriovorax stolpii]QDK42430.1 hypothetical protein DOM21_13435 [Bacteriovorax stolpii]TDP52779.1 hypothetical protein C8D79_2545 [Bacteriovorax stolpii]BDT27715.1 hypothetical protein BHI3_11810 [Bacteriovorax sp. HI3]